MIFPSIMFWVWMAAQQRGPLPNVAGWNVVGDCEAHHDTHIIDCRQKPAEHVIEIRTKREEVPPQEVADDLYRCPVDTETELTWPSGTIGDGPAKHTCVRVTREIWIDGVKWGVLRERGQ